MTTVLLVRHGETRWNRARRLQGWAPVPLAARGREQCGQLGATLAEQYAVDAITTSDLPRATESAALLADALGADVSYDADWRERDFGVLQGLSYQTFERRHPEFSLAQVGETAVSARPERGESLADVRERVLGAWDRLVAATDSNETHLVVSHGGPIYLVLGHLQGRTVTESVLEATQGNGAINEIHVDGDEASVVRENDTSWRDRGSDHEGVDQDRDEQ